MSESIDPREVLQYLNELGYTNINAHQLKDFIKDLKKLIKYENRTKNSAPERQNYDPINLECECESECEIDPIYETLYKQSTISSKAKEVPKKDKQISVQITKKKKKIDHPHCIHISGTPNDAQNEPKQSEVISSDTPDMLPTEATLKSGRSESKHSGTSKPSTKSKVTFIRPAKSKNVINKCDPVALYHHYQSVWKRVKIPGQDDRADLRWAIREKMLGEPKVSTRCLSRKSSAR